MKFVCLGYIDLTEWTKIPEEDRSELVDDCVEYDDHLRGDGSFLGGEGLDTPQNAKTLRWDNGKVSITDGPYAETKEQIGGILFLEARDMNHAIEIMSKHPGVRSGPFEIRPAVDMCDMIRESQQRRSSRKA